MKVISFLAIFFTIMVVGGAGFLFFGCAADGTSTIGDGKVDEIESGLIQAGAGLIFNNNPKYVIPVYAVSTALIQSPEIETISTLASLDERIEIEVSKLKLQPNEAASFLEFVKLVKAGVKAKLNIETLPDEYNYNVVIKGVIEAVNAAARARLPDDF